MPTNSPPTSTLAFTEAEVAMIVAALRNWLYDIEEGQDLEEAFIGHFARHSMMTEAETEALIRRFSFDESQGFIQQLF